MDYKMIEIDDYALKVEIGVIPASSISAFLSDVSVSDSITKTDYEDFLLTSLLKNGEEVAVSSSQLDEREKTVLRFQIVETIYKVNPKLRPHHIAIIGSSLMHRADAIRNGHSSYITLPSNPDWLKSVDIMSLVDAGPVKQLLEEIWVEIKDRFPAHEYIKQYVEALDLEVPILDVTSVPLTQTEIVEKFIEHRCHGNLMRARNSSRAWVGHVLVETIYKIDFLLTALQDAKYMQIYTDNVVTLQLYMASVVINPQLNWEAIDWSPWAEEAEPQITDEFVDLDEPEDTPFEPKEPKEKHKEKKKPLVRKPQRPSAPFTGSPSRPGRPGRPKKSSKEEVQEEQHLFKDVSFDEIKSLNARLKKKIIGQDEAIDTLTRAISIARVGLKDREKPIGSFLFAGTTGVGKTELARVLADELTRGNLIRLDCSEYSSAHEVSKIFGSPPGYVGFEDYSRSMGDNYMPPQTVAAKLKKNPFSIVLFDEIEQADPAIFNVLYQIMDAGRITSGRGEEIPFSQAIVLMTSNLGTQYAEKEVSSTKMGFGDDDRDFANMEKQIIRDEITKKFKPAFRNRLTETILFNRLDESAAEFITSLMLNKTKGYLKEDQKTNLTWDKRVVKYLLGEGFSQKWGARELQRTIDQQIVWPLSQYLLDNHIDTTLGCISSEGGTVRISMRNKKPTFRYEAGACDGKEDSDEKKGLSDNDNTTGRRRQNPDSPPINRTGK